MKSFITALAIGVILISGSILYMNHMTHTSEDLIAINKQISDEITKGDFKSAEDKIKQLIKKVDNFENFFLTTGDHTELDNIRTTTGELQSFVEGGHTADALSKIRILDFLFSHLCENSKIKLGNIL